MRRGTTRRIPIVAFAAALAAPCVWAADEPPAAGPAAGPRSEAASDPNAGPESIPHAGTERVEVTGERAPGDEAPTAFGTVILPEEYAGRVTSLAEVLGAAVGVRVRSYGGLNSFATVSVRGSTAEQVAVFLDGVPLNSPLGGGVDLSEVPLAGLSAIEVYRAFTPSSLGASSIGGAVEIRTRRSDGVAAAAGSIAAGSFGTFEATALVDWRSGPIRWAATAQGLATQGDFEYLDNNGTTLTTSDDEMVPRANNEGWTSSIRLRGETDLRSGGSLAVFADWVRRRRGVPGIDAFQSEQASFASHRGLLHVETAWPSRASGRMAFEGGLDYEYVTQTFEDDDQEISQQPQDTTSRAEGTGLRGRILWSPSAAHRVSALVEPRFQSASVTDRLHPAGDTLRARRTGADAVIEDEIRLAGGRLLVAPSLRWDWIRDASTGGGPATATMGRTSVSLSPRLGALVAIAPRWSLRGNIGRFYRDPGLLERYGNEGTIVGNPALLPERGVNSDLGVVFQGSAPRGRAPGARPRGPREPFLVPLSAEIVLFRTDADDLIQLLPLPSRVMKPFNVGRVRIEGVEASVALRIAGRLSWAANGTFQKAVDRSDTYRNGSDLPGRPALEADSTTTLGLGRLGLYHRFSFVGENDLAALGAAADRLPPERLPLTRLPARYLHDVGATFRITARADATLEIDNIFDRHVVDVARYPLPGRALFLKLTTRI